MRDFTQVILKTGQDVGAVRTDLPMELLVNVVFAMGEAVDMWLFEHFDEIEPKNMRKTAQMLIGLYRRVAEEEK